MSCRSPRACLKNHSRNLHAPLCGRFCPNPDLHSGVQYFRRPVPHFWNDPPIHRGWTDKLLLMPVLLFYDLVPYKVPPETKMPPVGDITHYIRKSVTLYLQTSSRTLRGKEDEKCSIAASPVFHPPEYHYSAFYIFAIHFFCHFVLKSCQFSVKHILLHILQCQ